MISSLWLGCWVLPFVLLLEMCISPKVSWAWDLESGFSNCLRPKAKDVICCWIFLWSIHYQLPPACYRYFYFFMFIFRYFYFFITITSLFIHYLSLYPSIYLSLSINRYSIATDPGVGIGLVIIAFTLTKLTISVKTVSCCHGTNQQGAKIGRSIIVFLNWTDDLSVQNNLRPEQMSFTNFRVA